MSQAQEYIQIYLWGFVESRDGVPVLAEAYGDLTGEIAVMNATERALELGFPPDQVNSLNSVLRGADDRGDFEVRPFWLEDVSVNGTHELFEEANDLADSVAHLLDALTHGDGEAFDLAMRNLEVRLRRYDERWDVSRR